jgi:hypothetical protein
VIPALVEVAVRLVLADTAPRSNAPLSRITTRVPVAEIELAKALFALFRITEPFGVPPASAVAVA